MQQAGSERRRPGQSECRTEVVVVRLHPIRLKEVVRVESRKSWKAQCVCELSEIFITQSEGHADGWGGQPGVLQEVSLTELIGMEDREREIFLNAACRSA